MPAALLLLSDGRFPAGGHAHSGGLEAAVTAGRVSDVPSLTAFLRGRMGTAGLVAGAFAAAACAASADAAALAELDAELDARMPSPTVRLASRRLGRQLLRAARAAWPAASDAWTALAAFPGGPHQPVAFGAAAAAAGVDPLGAATATIYDAAVGPATAAVRLLGLDPFAVHAALAGLSGAVDALAAEAASFAEPGVDPSELPSAGAPLLDLTAEQHARWEVRLFAS